MGSSGLNVNAGATATLNVARGTDSTSDLTISSNFWNGGGVTKTGNGIVTFTGSNVYTGATTVSAGTLSVGDGGTTGSLGSGAIALGNSTLTTGSATSTFAGSISGSGSLTKTGAGVLNLTGANTSTGNTSVQSGELKLNGSLASALVSIASGATLSGTGSLAGDITIAGIHSPGNSPGVQTIGGNLTYGAGSSLMWELGATRRRSPTAVSCSTESTSGAISRSRVRRP